MIYPSMAEREDFRTTVSFSKTVADWADDLMKQKGFNGNLSQFLAALVREEKVREEEKVLALHEAAKAGVAIPAVVSGSVSYKQQQRAALEKSRKQSKAHSA